MPCQRPTQPGGKRRDHDVRLWLQDAMFSKADLRLGRLINFGSGLYLSVLSVTVFWRQVRRVLGWLLLPLGQHALYAYNGSHCNHRFGVACSLFPSKWPIQARSGSLLRSRLGVCC